MKRLVLLLSVVGCATDPSTRPFEPDSVTSGIYDLEVTASADSCVAPRFVGTATVPLFATTGAISLTDVGTDAAQAYDLTVAGGYALQLPPDGSRVDPCPSSEGSVVIFYALTAASVDHVEATASETWTIASTCSGTIGASTVPQASCSATRLLRYDLLTACAAPCTIRRDLSQLTCECNP